MMPTKFIYKCTLTPMGSFYFGEEGTYLQELDGFEPTNTNKEAQINYFKKRQGYFKTSSLYPQQTQILGMLRNTMLLQYGHLYYYKHTKLVPKSSKDNTNNKEDAEKLVGKKRWSQKGDLELGIICSISEIYIEHKEKLYLPNAFDYGLTLVARGKGYINSRESKAYAFKKDECSYFDAKTDLNYKLVSKDGKSIDNNLFVDVITTHNQALNYKVDDKEQYFKIHAYKLKEKSTAFVFYLTTKEKLRDDFNNLHVKLGAENSYFILEVEQIKLSDRPNSKNFYRQSTHTRVVLISDTYVSDTIFEDCKVSMAEKVVFRSIAKDKKRAISHKMVLLKRGSVFYPKDNQSLKKIKKEIKKHKNFRTIGYNKFVIIEKKEIHHV